MDGKFFDIIAKSGEYVSASCCECNEIKKGSVKSTGNFKSHYRLKQSPLLEKLNAYLKNQLDDKATTQLTLNQLNLSTNAERVINLVVMSLFIKL